MTFGAGNGHPGTHAFACLSGRQGIRVSGYAPGMLTIPYIDRNSSWKMLSSVLKIRNAF
jgi:hypothetical protein